MHYQGEIKEEVLSSTKEIRIGTIMIICLVVGIFVLMNKGLENKLYDHFFGTSKGQIQLFGIALWVSFGLFVNKLLSKVKY